MTVYTLGATLLTKHTTEDTIAHFERLVESEEITGYVQIARCKTEVEGVYRIELMTNGLTPQEAWIMLGSALRGMVRTMGFKYEDLQTEEHNADYRVPNRR